MTASNHAEFATFRAALDKAEEDLRRNDSIEHERDTLKALTVEFSALAEVLTYRFHGDGETVAHDFSGLGDTLDIAFADAIEDRDRVSADRFRQGRIYGIAYDSARGA